MFPPSEPAYFFNNSCMYSAQASTCSRLPSYPLTNANRWVVDRVSFVRSWSLVGGADSALVVAVNRQTGDVQRASPDAFVSFPFAPECPKQACRRLFSRHRIRPME